MYHEIESPFAFLWHLRGSLKPEGQVVVVDANRATARHGTPPMLLRCEFGAVGYRLVGMRKLAGSEAYIALFQPEGEAPEPDAITPCKDVAPNPIGPAT